MQEANDLIRVPTNGVGRVDARLLEGVLDRRSGAQLTAQRGLVEAGQPLGHLAKLGVGVPVLSAFVT